MGLFKDLKKQNNVNSLIEELENNSKTKFIDERIWNCKIDEKTGTGTALIRFLPISKGGKSPAITMFMHGFKGPGGWYIENSLTTIGMPDPLNEMNMKLWATGIEENQNLVRKRKRNKKFFSNIYVISDPKSPENEGKVFLFRYGKQIFDKIFEKMQPQFEGETPIDVFDFWKGANFRLKVKKVDAFPKYDSSYFESPSLFLEGDEKKMEAIWNQQYLLEDLLTPKNFKTYEELNTRLHRVLGGTFIAGETNPTPTKEAEAIVPKKEKLAAKMAVADPDEDDTKDSLAYFESLASS